MISIKPTAINVPGEAGNLEGLYTPAPAAAQGPGATAVICHPNPVEKGTMHHKVVTMIAQAFQHQGYATVRFNYRGVGSSGGAYGEVVGEIADLRAVIAWARVQAPGDRIALAGFSFGAYIAAAVAAEDPTISRLLTVAPAVDRHDFSVLTGVQCPWTLIASDADEVTPYSALTDFLSAPPVPQIDTVLMPGASHFFHGELIPLRTRLIEALAEA